MPRHTSILALLVAALIAAAPALSQPAEQGGQPPRYHRYVYYPAQQIYYSTEQQIWFWPNGGGWSYGVHLPAQFRDGIGTGLPLRLATDRPYIAHAEVEQRFGQPWRERHHAQPDDAGEPMQEVRSGGSESG